MRDYSALRVITRISLSVFCLILLFNASLLAHHVSRVSEVMREPGIKDPANRRGMQDAGEKRARDSLRKKMYLIR